MARDRVAEALAVAYWRYTPAGREALALVEEYNNKWQGEEALSDMELAGYENGDNDAAFLAGLLQNEPGFQFGNE